MKTVTLCIDKCSECPHYDTSVAMHEEIYGFCELLDIDMNALEAQNSIHPDCPLEDAKRS
jgi:hypothetical protein